MGRTEPSQGLAPPSFRRDARAKKAKATINKVIPSLLSAHPRAKRGAETSELIVEPPAPKPRPTPPKDKDESTPSRDGPSLGLQVADTLTVARSLLLNASTGQRDLGNKEAKVAMLNMASPLSPGGGFINGASSQEESLCMRSTLLSSLKDEFYRLPELGAVYTPDVLVFRDEQGGDLEKRDRWFVDCVSAAMLRMPETEVDERSGRGKYGNEKDRELVVRKMRAVLRIFQAKGAKKVVLGAWGCGAYGNPVGEVSAAWSKVLLGGKNKSKAKKEQWDGIDEIVFAIKDSGLADAFQRAFGEGLTRHEPDELEEQQADVSLRKYKVTPGFCRTTEDDLEALGMKELQDKIQELELTVEQAKSPQLKSGLNSVLAQLRNQAAEGRHSSEKGPASHGNEDATDSDNDADEAEDDVDEDTEEDTDGNPQ
ncbi:hypothetical protein BJ170DRAFT_589010 [Xylariales sp. AK1849]|nr:hypothetical protein BJ170DRAFT_589010 [Xylariales sp. AK1849]